MERPTDRWELDESMACADSCSAVDADPGTSAAVDVATVLSARSIGRLMKALALVSDPRSARGVRHPVINVLVIAVLGCVCGCDDAEALEDWAAKETTWLSGFLVLDHGTPSQDVFLRVLAAMDPVPFRIAFVTWAREVMRSIGVTGQIAVDGQTHRGSHDRPAGQKPVHVVSALACESGLVLGQQDTDAKSNEITAIPALLQLLHLKGSLVSIDAMGCQTKIAKLIVDRGGDYLFGLKGNQSTLQEQTAALFDDVLEARKRPDDQENPPTVEQYEETDGGHGRIEVRKAIVCHDFKKHVPATARFTRVRTLIAILSVREDTNTGKTTTERRLYISSRKLSAKEALNATRVHWAVENRLHWCLDVTFGQDANRTRTKNAATNLGVVRTFALNLVRAYAGDKLSVPRRRRRCDYTPDYRRALLAASAGF